MMFELIRANKQRSIVLMTLMAAVLGALGLALGAVFLGPQGAVFGVAIAWLIFLILMLVSYYSGDQILLSASKAVLVEKQTNPQLFNVVEEMTIAASMPKMPKIYIIPDPAPNAFATGRKPEDASIAVTAGLLGRLNRDELQGVIAHEISHIVHRDILFVTLAGIMLGSIVMLSEIFLRSMFWGTIAGSGRRYRGRSRDSSGSQVIVAVIAIIAAILAPILAYMLYYSLSRQREYLADAGAARLTRYPEGLASALEKISASAIPSQTANKVTAPMYISPPLNADKMAFAGIGQTHPPIEKRVKILRSMTHGASLKDYSAAYKAFEPKGQKLPPSMSADTEQLNLRKQSEQKPQTKKDQKQQLRQVGDIIRTLEGFTFLSCTCGLKMKIPPNYKSNKIKCPRCASVHSLKETNSSA